MGHTIWDGLCKYQSKKQTANTFLRNIDWHSPSKVNVSFATIIIVIIVILSISFVQGIYTHIPETNHVPGEHCVSTILM
jgi:hypothetical protein